MPERKDCDTHTFIEKSFSYMYPSDLIPTKHRQYYAVFLARSFFYHKGDSICSAIRKMLCDMFKIENFYVTKKGITITWSRYIQDLDVVAIREGKPNEVKKLIKTMLWIKEFSIKAQKRARYDRTKKRCVLYERRSSGSKMLLSPRTG